MTARHPAIALPPEEIKHLPFIRLRNLDWFQTPFKLFICVVTYMAVSSIICHSPPSKSSPPGATLIVSTLLKWGNGIRDKSPG